MRSCFVLLFVSLLTSCEAQGTFGTPVFVLKGRDLLLKLHDDPPEGVSYVEWKINKTVLLVRFGPSGKAAVTGRLELGGESFSVVLKNLQEADSGVYSAVAKTSTGDKPVAEYKVTVQGTVSPADLIVDRVDSSGSESCDIHVTCMIPNSNSISSTFKCPKGVCSQGEGERSEVTTSGASLHVYLLKNLIICEHRNQVHRSQDSIPAEDLCPSKSDPPLPPGWPTIGCTVALAVITPILVVVIVGLIVWLCYQRRIIRSLQRKTDEANMEEAALVEMDLLNKRAPAPPQDGTPADPDPGLKERQENAAEEVMSLLKKIASTAPPRDGSRRRMEANLEEDPLEERIAEERLERLERQRREQWEELQKEQLDRVEELLLQFFSEWHRSQ